jgi:hypothetical protein
MLSVAPGKVILGSVAVVPATPAMISVVLLVIVRECHAGLRTAENFRSGDSAIKLGWRLLRDKPTDNGDSVSLEASTMLMTGALNPPLGDKGFETKARNLSPLVRCVLPLLLLEDL